MAAGLISGAAAIGVSQLVAGVTGPGSAPVPAVGAAVIDLTPTAVKDFAISTFGSNDKTALITGILILLVVFAALIGVLAVRRASRGLEALAGFTAIGLFAALTRPGAGLLYALPTLAGAVVAVFVLTRLVNALHAAPAGRAASGRASYRQAGPGAGTGPDRDEPGTSRVPPATPAEPGAAPQALTASPGAAALPAGPGRRQFLITGSTAVVVAGLSALGGRALSGPSTQVTQALSTLRFPTPAHPAPPLPAGADLHIPGLSPFITPNPVFYRVDTALFLPQVPPSTWRLRVHGMVDRPLVLSYDDLLRMPLIEDYITLCCVSNPVAGPYIGNAKWLGASLASVLRAAGIRRGASQLFCTSTDGFTSGAPVQTVMDGRDSLLAVAMNGKPLPVEHGFPVRMVVPGLYGYVSATKWLTDIEVTTFGAAQAYWVQRGWSQQAPIKTESRIDVPYSGSTVRAGRVAVAGEAWAQHKGIDAVHVRVDGGAWQPARLAAVPGIDTWRQWVFEWDARPGTHRIEARATDDTGYTQTGVPASPVPNGATGYPMITVTAN
jgi:DMSO/TMAO reductase YedYZ molybdopterin-dependent catalytic subunit